MDLERPEKQAVRDLWVMETSLASQRAVSDDTLFLTLSGAEGRDIEALIAAGIIATTANNAIAESDKFKVVAVESSPLAVLELQKKFPGLKILEQSFQSVIRGPGPYSWPNREDEKRFCRALVVNLDLNDALKADIDDGHVGFPIAGWIAKLAQLHADNPRRNWSLCLTLHGEILWNEEVSQFVQQFLAENFTREMRFAAACELFLGEDLCGKISAAALRDFSGYSRDVHQQVLMVFVPKYILSKVQHLGWKITTERNLRYGSPGAAPMVTWICRFDWSISAINSPDTVYRDALAGILRAAGTIESDGSIRVQSG